MSEVIGSLVHCGDAGSFACTDFTPLSTYTRTGMLCTNGSPSPSRICKWLATDKYDLIFGCLRPSLAVLATNSHSLLFDTGNGAWLASVQKRI